MEFFLFFIFAVILGGIFAFSPLPGEKIQLVTTTAPKPKKQLKHVPVIDDYIDTEPFQKTLIKKSPKTQLLNSLQIRQAASNEEYLDNLLENKTKQEKKRMKVLVYREKQKRLDKMKSRRMPKDYEFLESSHDE